MAPPGRAKVVEALGQLGMTEDDYRVVEDARAMIDAVNARLAGRGSPVVCAVSLAMRPEPSWPSAMPDGDQPAG